MTSINTHPFIINTYVMLKFSCGLRMFNYEVHIKNLWHYIYLNIIKKDNEIGMYIKRKRDDNSPSRLKKWKEANLRHILIWLWLKVFEIKNLCCHHMKVFGDTKRQVLWPFKTQRYYITLLFTATNYTFSTNLDRPLVSYDMLICHQTHTTHKCSLMIILLIILTI